jgi:hypothetical protein
MPFVAFGNVVAFDCPVVIIVHEVEFQLPLKSCTFAVSLFMLAAKLFKKLAQKVLNIFQVVTAQMQ